MVAEVAVGTGVFAALLNSVKGLKDINDASIRNEVSIALQRQILDAQAAQMALVQRVSDLEKDVARFEQWDAEKQRYQLEELPPGLFVYGIKQEARASDPDHKLCANCYQKRVKSILQRKAPHRGETDWSCPNCGFTGTSGTSEPWKGPSRPSGGNWMA